MNDEKLTDIKFDELTSRINALAAKNKSSGLTEEEKAERDALRREYVRRFHESLRSELDSVYYVGDDGEEHKLGKKEASTEK